MKYYFKIDILKLILKIVSIPYCQLNNLNLLKGYIYSFPMSRMILAFILPFVIFFNISAQTKIKISQPLVKFENNLLIIDYGITGSSYSDLFKVWLEVTDNYGKNIKAESVDGDIGDSINGGLSKRIVWDVIADNISPGSGIYIEVVAERMISPVSQVLEKKDQTVDISKEYPQKAQNNFSVGSKDNTVVSAPVKVGNSLLLSTIFPGWGLTKLTNGKPYWLIGIIGTGCIASSVLFNSSAASRYDDYLNSANPEERADYFDIAQRNYVISKVCAWTAVVIWATDLGISGLKTIKMNKTASNKPLNTLSIGSNYDHFTRSGFLCVYYNF